MTKLHSLRDREPEAIRDDPAVIAARHNLAAQSQTYKGWLHPIRKLRLIWRYVNARLDAEGK